MSNTKHAGLAWFVIFSMPLSGMCLDIYTPALPLLSHYFSANPLHIKMTIVIYMFGYGLSTLFWGPLSDHFGRKSIILLGLYIFLLSNLAVVFSHSLVLLLILRLIQGIAVGAINTPCRAVFVDIFKGDQFARYTNFTTIAWSLSPIIAPVIGSYLISWFPWQSVFIALSIYGVIQLCWAHLVLYRTNANVIPFHLVNVSRNFLHILSNKEFRGTILIVIFSYSVLTIFYVTGPFIIQHLYVKSAIFYGHCAALFGIAWLLGNVVCRFLAKKRNSIKMSFSCLSMLLVCLVGTLLDPYISSIALYLVVMLLLVFIGAFVFPSSYIASLSLFPEMAGTLSAAVGGIFWAGGSLATVFAGFISLHDIRWTLLSYVGLSILFILVFFFYLPKGAILKK